MEEIWRGPGAFGELVVRQDRRVRQLLVAGVPQGGMYLDDPDRGQHPYSDYLLLAPALAGAPRRALVVGLGAAEGVKALRRACPECAITVVEPDPAVVRVAREFFHLPPEVAVAVAGGRAYLEQAPGPWDLVFLDAFQGDAIPCHLATVECLQAIRARLAPGGMLAANYTGGPPIGPGSRLFRALYRTQGAVFAHRYVFPVQWRAAGATAPPVNVLTFCAGGPRLSAAALQARARLAGLADLAADLYTGPIPTGDVPELRDRDCRPGGLLRP